MIDQKEPQAARYPEHFFSTGQDHDQCPLDRASTWRYVRTSIPHNACSLGQQELGMWLEMMLMKLTDSWFPDFFLDPFVEYMQGSIPVSCQYLSSTTMSVSVKE